MYAWINLKLEELLTPDRTAQHPADKTQEEIYKYYESVFYKRMNYLLLRPTLEHTYLDFPHLTFLKQDSLFIHLLFSIIACLPNKDTHFNQNGRQNNTEKIPWCINLSICATDITRRRLTVSICFKAIRWENVAEHFLAGESQHESFVQQNCTSLVPWYCCWG